MSAEGAQQNKQEQLIKLFICVVECFCVVTYWVSVVLCLQFDVLRLAVVTDIPRIPRFVCVASVVLLNQRLVVPHADL